jgi:hypothetical protein
MIELAHEFGMDSEWYFLGMLGLAGRRLQRTTFVLYPLGLLAGVSLPRMK